MRDFDGLSSRVVFCFVVKKYVHLAFNGIKHSNIQSYQATGLMFALLTRITWLVIEIRTLVAGPDGLS